MNQLQGERERDDACLCDLCFITELESRLKVQKSNLLLSTSLLVEVIVCAILGNNIQARGDAPAIRGPAPLEWIKKTFYSNY